MAAFTGIDHVGIAVPDLDAAVAAYERLTQSTPSHRDRVESDGIEAVMFQVDESRIELLGSTTADSKIANFLAKRGGGLHHVAYAVDDVLRLLDSCPRRGALKRDGGHRRYSSGDGAGDRLLASARAVLHGGRHRGAGCPG